MRIDLAALFDDPSLMFYAFEDDHARFLPMDRASFERSIFLDRRIEPAERKIVRVPLEPLLNHMAERGFVPPRLQVIHHMAQTGSTLLARALDRGPRSLVHREPLHLRQLAVHAGAGFQVAHSSRNWRAMLGFSLTMLGKRFQPQAAAIVKGNVPISMIGDAIADADPGQAGILLHFPLEDYCAAVLRTPQHRAWVDGVANELRLGDDPVVGAIGDLDTAHKAAALWLSMTKRFAALLHLNPAMHSLDANHLFDVPKDTIAATSELFGVGLSSDETAAIADGPLFSTYAKNPAQPYAQSLRRERQVATKAALRDELDAARRWVEMRAAIVGLPDALDRPLIGHPTALLQG